MPYALSKQGAIPDDARVAYPATDFLKSTSANFTGDWEIFFDIEVTGADLPFLSANFNSSQLLFFRAGNRLEFRRSQSATVQVTLNQAYSSRSKYSIVGRSATSDIAVFQNDILCGTISLNSIDDFDDIFTFGNSSREGLLYSLKIYNNGNLERDYTKESLVGSNDAEYTETVNSQHGTLLGFPTDNSQWVFYGDGGGSEVTSDVAFSVSAPAVSASASATLPQPSADIGYSVSLPTVNASVSASLPQPSSDVAFAVNAPTITGDLAASSPQPQSDVVFTVNAPVVSANASAAIPGYNASVSFTVNSPSVSADASVTLPNPTANIAYTVSAPSISADAAATLPQPDSGVAFTVNTPSVNATASATQTGWNADVNFAVNSPSVSISASATLPPVTADCNISVNAPSFNVYCYTPNQRLRARKTISVNGKSRGVVRVKRSSTKTIRIN